MEGGIGDTGILWIRRGSKDKYQGCVYDSEDYCGDGCPQFEEPITDRSDVACILNICQKKQLYFNKFTDERK